MKKNHLQKVTTAVAIATSKWKKGTECGTAGNDSGGFGKCYAFNAVCDAQDIRYVISSFAEEKIH